MSTNNGGFHETIQYLKWTKMIFMFVLLKKN